jgi:hypothetical protein
MPNDDPSTDVPPARGSTVEDPPHYEHVEDDGTWIEEPEELPRRPRRRLLTPATGALLAVLLIAGGFLGGVLVEKGQSISTSSPSGAGAAAAARLGRLAGGATGSGPRGSGASAGPASAGGGGATIGQVAFIQGSTLYVTDTQGSTVKVTTSAGSTITKSVKASAKSIHPGETVIVTGATGADGTVTAESIRVGGGGEGGVPALPSGSSSGKAAGREPSLFGSGG